MITIETKYLNNAPQPQPVNRLERFSYDIEAINFIDHLLKKYKLCTGKVYINNQLKNTF